MFKCDVIKQKMQNMQWYWQYDTMGAFITYRSVDLVRFRGGVVTFSLIQSSFTLDLVRRAEHHKQTPRNLLLDQKTSEGNWKSFLVVDNNIIIMEQQQLYEVLSFTFWLQFKTYPVSSIGHWMYFCESICNCFTKPCFDEWFHLLIALLAEYVY